MAIDHPSSAAPKKWNDSMHDEIIDEIHAYRAALSDRFNGDIAELIKYYQSLDVPIPLAGVKPQPRRPDPDSY